MSAVNSIPMVDISGKSVGELDAPADLFGVVPNEAVVHFVCEGQRFRFYKKTASTKGRSQVSGGGKKSRKQKGTGGARQGGTRAPHWVGGGKAFGPNAIKRDFKVNKRLYKIALASVLTDRHSSGQVKVLSADLKQPKSKSVASLLSSLSLKGARVGFVVQKSSDVNLSKSAKNIRNVDVLTEDKWTTLDFVKTDSLIFSKAGFDALVGRLQGRGE